MIPQDTIAQIFETARVEEVVGDFVLLKKKGTNMWGLCPFHNEKTPSFSVSPSKGIYKCFGCGEGGNAVNFMMAHDHMTYPEALRFLAKKYSIDIEEEELSPEKEQELNERESLFLAMQYAQKRFTHNLLETETGKAIGLSYFKERGFSDETIKEFELGYATDDRKSFSARAIIEQFKKEHLITAGLSMEYDGKLTDRFHGRVMFPIRNLSGRVIAFGGRTLRTDKKIAKYINSPETPLYNKTNVLYGIFESKKTIINSDNCFLVEGYTDVISLHQAGIKNVVASSGTSLTTEQIRLIKRYTTNLTIMYDGDAAGIKASFRGIDMVLEEGLNVRTLLFPEGEDPDSFARKTDEVELKKFIEENATDFIRFKTDILAEEAKGDPIKTAALIKDIVHSISLIPDPITRSLYVKECASIMKIEEQLLVSELNKERRKKLLAKQKADGMNTRPDDFPMPTAEALQPQQTKEEAFSDVHQEKDIVRLLLMYGEKEIELPVEEETKDDETGKGVDPTDPILEKFNVADIICEELRDNNVSMTHPACNTIVKEFMRSLEDGFVLTHHHFTAFADPEVSKLTVELISSRHTLSEKWRDHNIFVTTEENQLERAVTSSLNAIKLRRVEAVIREVKSEIEKGGDDLDSILVKFQGLLELRKILAKNIGAIIIR